MVDQSTTWLIRVHGYGTYYFKGTEAEAETVLVQKGQLGCSADLKWRKDLSRASDKIAAEIARLLDAGLGVTSELFKQRCEALRAEAELS